MKVHSFLTRANKRDIAHSSGYAKQRNGENFGSTGGAGARRIYARSSAGRGLIRDYSQNAIARYDYSQRRGKLENIGRTESRIASSREVRADYYGQNSTSNAGAGDASNQSRPTIDRERYSGVAQSGVVGGFSAPQSSSSAPARLFHSVRPKF